MRKICCVVSVQNGVAAILRDPQDRIAGSIRGDARCRARIAKGVAGLRRWRASELRLSDGEGLDVVADGAVVNRVVEVGGHGEYGTSQRPLDLLVDVVRVGIKLSHGVAVHYIDIRVLTGADRKVS